MGSGSDVSKEMLVSDLMPINNAVTNSGNILLQETMIEILAFKLAASRLISTV